MIRLTQRIYGLLWKYCEKNIENIKGKVKINMIKESKKAKKRNNIPMIAAAVVLCLAVAITFIVRQYKHNIAEIPDNGTPQVIAEGESLIIPVSDISTTVSFYPVEIDGTQMEVIAVLDSEGNIRTAFNTCQICYGSGLGYYIQDGNDLVCQNCGNRFTVDEVEIKSGGCNPLPIFEENKIVTDGTIEITYDFLNRCKKIFSNWKA